MFEGIAKKVEAKGITLSITNEAKQYIADAGFDPVYGARPLKRALYEIVEDTLADMILEDKIGENSIVKFDLKNNEIVVDVK